MVVSRDMQHAGLEVELVSDARAKVPERENRLFANAMPSLPRQHDGSQASSFAEEEVRDGPPLSRPTKANKVGQSKRSDLTISTSSRSSPFLRREMTISTLRSKQSLQENGFQAAVFSQVLKQKQHNLASPVLNPVDKLKNRLSKFTRSNDRRMMIRTIEQSPLLNDMQIGVSKSWPLEDPEQLEDLHHEVASGKLNVNGVPITGFGVEKPWQYMDFLGKLCRRLTNMHKSSTSAEDHLCSLIPRLALSTIANDVFFQLNAIVGSPNLMLQPPKTSPSKATELQLYCDDSSGHVQALILTKHPFGLFRKSDLVSSSKRPWIRLVVSVQERVNLTTGSSFRSCSVQVYDKH